MITLILSVLAAVAVGAGLRCGLDWPWVWSIVLGVVSFFAVQIVLGMRVRKRIMEIMTTVQGIMTDGQKRLQEKIQRWQIRPPGSMQAAQKEIADDTRVFVKEAIAATEALDKFRLWVPMIDRQKATAQLQLNWMIRDFRKVDELMPKALLVDPTMVAMKIARLQMLDRPIEEIRKVYEKGVRRLKYNQNVLLAACYSWILVKRELVDEAFKVLTEALRNSDNETLRQNHEILMNNRVAHFSNSGLGDMWYSLMLEEPKVRMQRPRSVYR